MDPITIITILVVVAFGGGGWLIFGGDKKKTKTIQDNDIVEETQNEKQITIDNTLQPVQEKFNIPRQEFNNAKAVYNKNLDKGFEYLEALEMEYNSILKQLDNKEKSTFQLEFDKLLDVKQIIDKQLDNLGGLIIDDEVNENHKDTVFFNINDIKSNIEEYKSILNNLIKNAENEEIKLALEGKYKSYINVYDYIVNNTQKIIDATRIEGINQQTQTIEQIINPDTMEQDLINKIIDGDNNYLTNHENNDNLLQKTILWIDNKIKGINDLENKIIKSKQNNNYGLPSAYNDDVSNTKNNNQANISNFDLTAMLEELNNCNNSK